MGKSYRERPEKFKQENQSKKKLRKKKTEPSAWNAQQAEGRIKTADEEEDQKNYFESWDR